MSLDRCIEPGSALPEPVSAEAGVRRVALMFGSFKAGGVARVMLLAAQGFVDRGFAVDLVVGRNQGDLCGEVPEGARIVELERAPKLAAWSKIVMGDPAMLFPLLQAVLFRRGPSGKLLYLPSAIDYLRSARPDGVLAATAPFNLIAVLSRRIANRETRVIVGEHNQLSSETTGGHRWRYDCPPAMLRRCYLAADAISAVSDGVAAELTGHCGIPKDRIATVHNPVVGPRLHKKAMAAVNHPWFAVDQPPVVLAAGKLKPQKDFPTLIRAFAKVRRERPARLVVLGDVRGSGKDADYVAHLRELPAQLGIADDVSFAGFTDNPFAYMSRSSVFVLSSAWEGLPTVLIEALACGCPVVSTDCPSGPADILDHGRFGPLVPVGDVDALAAAICQILDTPPSRVELTSRAALFTVERAIDRYVELLFGPGHGATSAG